MHKPSRDDSKTFIIEQEVKYETMLNIREKKGFKSTTAVFKWRVNKLNQTSFIYLKLLLEGRQPNRCTWRNFLTDSDSFKVLWIDNQSRPLQDWLYDHASNALGHFLIKQDKPFWPVLLTEYKEIKKDVTAYSIDHTSKLRGGLKFENWCSS